MKQFKILPLLVFLSTTVFFFQCSSDVVTEEIKVKVKEIKKSDKIELSSICEQGNYIALETNSKALINRINRVCINDKIYCLSDDKIIVFDLTGIHLFSIDYKKTKAAFGYTEISDFYIDTLKNQIEVLDRMGKRIIFYSSINGEFIKSNKIPLYAQQFIKTINNDYIFCSAYNKESKIILTKLDETLKKTEVLLKGKLWSFSGKNLRWLYNYEGNTYFCMVGSNNIYKYSDQNNIEIIDKFNFGEYKLNSEIRKQLENNTITVTRIPKEKESAFFLGNYFNYKFGRKYSYMYKGQSCIVYNSNSSSKEISGKYHVNDLDGGYSFSYSSHSSNQFVFACQAYKLLSHFKKLKEEYSIQDWEDFSQKHKPIMDILNKIDKSDNPVLYICKPKEF